MQHNYKFKLDRTSFKAGKAGETDSDVQYWVTRSYKERLEAAWYLINSMYGTTAQTKLDRTVFSMRKHNG